MRVPVAIPTAPVTSANSTQKTMIAAGWTECLSIAYLVRRYTIVVMAAVMPSHTAWYQ